MRKLITAFLILTIGISVASAVPPKKHAAAKKKVAPVENYTKEKWIGDTPTAYFVYGRTRNFYGQTIPSYISDEDNLAEFRKHGYQIPDDNDCSSGMILYKPGVCKIAINTGSGGEEQEFRFIGRPELAEKFAREAKILFAKTRPGVKFRVKQIREYVIISSFQYEPAYWDALKPSID